MVGRPHIQEYAMLYADEIAGMVFIDPIPKELVDTLSDKANADLIVQGAPRGLLLKQVQA